MNACKLLVNCVPEIYPAEKVEFSNWHVVAAASNTRCCCYSLFAFIVLRLIHVRWEVCYNLLASQIALPGLVWAQRTPCHTCHSCCAHKYMCKLYTCVYTTVCVCVRLPIISVLINECWNVENCLLTSRERAHRTSPAHVCVLVCGYPCRLLVFGNVRK